MPLFLFSHKMSTYPGPFFNSRIKWHSINQMLGFQPKSLWPIQTPKTQASSLPRMLNTNVIRVGVWMTWHYKCLTNNHGNLIWVFIEEEGEGGGEGAALQVFFVLTGSAGIISETLIHQCAWAFKKWKPLSSIIWAHTVRSDFPDAVLGFLLAYLLS